MAYMDQLQFLFITIFVVGFGLPLVNVILGALFSSGDVDADADMAADADFDVDLDVDINLDVGMDLNPEADLELPDLDADPAVLRTGSARTGGRIRFNMNCLCLAMVVFSAISYYRVQFVADTPGLIGVLAVDALIAMAAYLLLYYFVVRKLKTNDASALKSDSLIHRKGVVTVPIIEEQIGKIQLKDALGASITYLAKIDRDICREVRISPGTVVLITELDRKNRICYVAVSGRQKTEHQ